MLKKKFVIIGAILLLSTSGAMAQKVSPAARAVLGACKPDIAHFCSQVPPGQGRTRPA